MNKFYAFCNELTADIKQAYEGSVTIQEAEKLAAKFLYAQMAVANELSQMDLDSRMKKSGLKAVKAAIYMQEATKESKKPSDTFLGSAVDMNKMVMDEQESFDQAEVSRDQLQNYLTIFKEAHVFFRQISKAGYSG